MRLKTVLNLRRAVTSEWENGVNVRWCASTCVCVCTAWTTFKRNRERWLGLSTFFSLSSRCFISFISCALVLYNIWMFTRRFTCHNTPWSMYFFIFSFIRFNFVVDFMCLRYVTHWERLNDRTIEIKQRNHLLSLFALCSVRRITPLNHRRCNVYWYQFTSLLYNMEITHNKII